MSFSERLQTAMRIRGKTQKDLSVNCNIDKGSISHYLGGDYTPKMEKIITIAEYLNVDPAFLLGLQDNIKGDMGKPLNSLFENEELTAKKELIREIHVICSYEDVDSLKTILSVVQTLAKHNK